ncbi:MAG: hypothetical protein NT145_03905 [Elusimicrobia bacterium]|nr:hypothetical protein [Elusimicrobiota bacterium]
MIFKHFPKPTNEGSPQGYSGDGLRANSGSALVTVMIIMISVTILAVVGTQFIMTSFKDAKRQLNMSAQAENVARAGLADTIAWFKRQQIQPVKMRGAMTYPDEAFNPKFSTDSAKCDTIDESVGLVKEYPLSENNILWARYEVRKQTAPPAAIDPFAVHDVTGERLSSGEVNGDGYVWFIPSKGYIYRRKDPNVAFNVSPNEIIGSAKVSTEIRRITLNLPVTCANIVNNGGTAGSQTVRVNSRGRIVGGTYGCGRTSGVVPVVSGANAQVSPPAGPPLADNYTEQFVLGVTKNELRVLADFYVSSVNDLPNPLPDLALIYINGNAVFNAARPLRGSGLLYVDGNLTLTSTAGSSPPTSHFFSGFIYVSGNVIIQDPAYVGGCLVSYGGLTLSRAAPADFAEIIYDQNALNIVRQQICQYREMKSLNRIFTGVKDY